jgi:hypothetical protein
MMADRPQTKPRTGVANMRDPEEKNTYVYTGLSTDDNYVIDGIYFATTATTTHHNVSYFILFLHEIYLQEFQNHHAFFTTTMFFFDHHQPL